MEPDEDEGSKGRSLRDRSTADVVILMLVVLVSFILIVDVVGIILLSLQGKTDNLNVIVESMNAIITTLIGAIIGYVGGKAQPRN